MPASNSNYVNRIENHGWRGTYMMRDDGSCMFVLVAMRFDRRPACGKGSDGATLRSVVVVVVVCWTCRLERSWRSKHEAGRRLLDISANYQNTHLLVSSLPLMYLSRLLGLSLRWCDLFRWNMLGVWMISIDRFGTILETK